jgi:pyruvate/2-oxoglutarate dehydrogenase complex dihydrolipoamide dehydrogenase (E3) component
VKFGKGESFDPNTVVITDDMGKKETVTGEYIILATGSRPAFPGNEKARVLNSDQLLKSTLVPKNLFVIGGGYIGCELAAIFRAKKVTVTLAEAESRLIPGWDERRQPNARSARTGGSPSHAKRKGRSTFPGRRRSLPL